MILPSLAELIGMAPQASALPPVYHACRDILEGRVAGTATGMASIISASPLHANRVLAMVNAPSEGDATPIHTISRAVNLFGMQRIHDLVLASCLAETLHPLVSVSKLKHFWRQSLRMAQGAKAAARVLRLRDPERPFVEGLLADIGLLLMWHADAAAMRQVEAEAIGQAIPVNMRERACFGYDNADVARELARAWGLPSALMLALGGQHAPVDAAPHQLEAALLNLARSLASVVPGTGSTTLLSRDTLHILGLEDEPTLSKLRREALEIPDWLPEALGLNEAPPARRAD
ncbi:HDOD domain-containing protein [Cognatazoarcus halotolerans]|uniref:HDOD domain-containing protein n=1 Tax=Cognatazoarcus halotolerans TaxID=2686016 RepID=UPI001358C38D|nr:HDOD domain-containing protein [Cognatazoarcus halotolerans]MCP5310761.1 HDOD domain-containing protein [Zoogloeaceae bacterium]MCP5466027.1 HDOD domain-containing protein [Nevskiaceae bacterium]